MEKPASEHGGGTMLHWHNDRKNTALGDKIALIKEYFRHHIPLYREPKADGTMQFTGLEFFESVS